MANKVLVDQLAVTMELKNNGIRLQIVNGDGKHRGYLDINKGYIRWTRGKERSPTGEISLDDFIKKAEARLL
jgi:hypothetical protein